MIYRVNNFFNNKNTIIVFFLLIISVLISLFSAKDTTNFFFNIDDLLHNNVSNLLFCFVTFYSVILYLKYNTNYMFINRIGDYKNYIKSNLKIIFLINIVNVVTYIILAIAIHLPFCDISNNFPNYYNLPYVVYVVFFLVRYIFIIQLLSYIYYLIYENRNQILQYVFLIFIVFSFFYEKYFRVTHFYKMIYLPSAFMTWVNYSSFWLEIICSLIQIVILLIAFNILFLLLNKRRRDIRI